MRRAIIILASIVTTVSSTCRTNEIYREIYTDAHCAGTQDYTCSAKGTETGCYCRDGYALDWKNDCVEKERCCKDPNAWHRVNWYEYTCDTLDSPVTIPDSVRCFCKENYARHDGKCIPKDQCPPRCSRPNEYYNPAGCDTNCEGFVYESCKLNPNCKCVDGRVRNKTGACIWKTDCPITCTGQYEIPLDAGCDVTCDNRVYSTSQGKGCYCKNGAVRNNGICILKADCPIMCTGYNEVPQESGCDYTCDDEVYSTSFGKGCYCISGTVRNKTTGACSPKKDCPIKCTGQREVPKDSGCDYTCDGGVYSTSYDKGCYCEYGAVRQNGICVLKADCPIKCTGQREVSQDSGCDYTCDGRVFSTSNGKGCYCEYGAVRNNGVCVLKADCPIKCTGQNETPQESGCDYTCDDTAYSTSFGKGCYCISGTVRNKTTGACFPKKDCPVKCTGQREVPQDSGCDYTCDGGVYSTSYGKGCYCEYGAVRQNGVCVLKADCPIKCTGQNETPQESGCDYTCDDTVYSTSFGKGCYCISGTVRNKTTGACFPKKDCPVKCTGQREVPQDSGCDYICDGGVYSTSYGKGCYCEYGAVRQNGICVLKAACPVKCTGQREVPQDSGCDYTCDGGVYSTSYGKGCYCEYGAVRNNGICVLKADCPIKCTGQNETPQESGCDYTCDDTVYSTSFGKGCYCISGTVRNKTTGACTPKKDCPIKCTGQNETPQESGCDYTCDDTVYSTSFGKGCYCISGTVRNRTTGACTLKKDCPIKCTGQNETPQESGCDYTCDDTVYSTSFGKGCYCISGTVRNKTTGACTPQKDCPIKCTGQNETPQESGCDYTCDDTVYSTSFGKGCYCISGTVRNKTTGACTPKKDCPIKCTGQNETPQESGCDYTCDDTVYSTSFGKGCYCISGAVRNKTTGACIFKKDCPIKCTGPYEVYKISGCEATCIDQSTCASKGKACYCESDRVRNKSGVCCLKTECPKKCTGQYEVYRESGCDYDCFNKAYGTSRGSGCYCEDGKVRNKYGDCVAKERCS